MAAAMAACFSRERSEVPSIVSHAILQHDDELGPQHGHVLHDMSPYETPST